VREMTSGTSAAGRWWISSGQPRHVVVCRRTLHRGCASGVQCRFATAAALPRPLMFREMLRQPVRQIKDLVDPADYLSVPATIAVVVWR